MFQLIEQMTMLKRMTPRPDWNAHWAQSLGMALVVIFGLFSCAMLCALAVVLVVLV